MKSLGVIRAIDNLGRVVVPKEVRRVFNWNEGDSVEFYTEGETVVLKKYQPGCIFCGETNVTTFKGKRICQKCRAELRRTT